MLLDRRKVGRTPAVRHGGLSGIVPRGDLTRMKLTSSNEVRLDQAPPDGARIGRDPLARVCEQPWFEPFASFLEVDCGLVTIHCLSRAREVRRGLRMPAIGVMGVREVRLELAMKPSTTLLARQASAARLTGHPATENRPGGYVMRRLLAATDLSLRSDRAVRRAAGLAGPLGAELLLLYVVDDDRPASLLDAERREALSLLQGRAAELAKSAWDPAPRALVETGDPFDGINRAAEAQTADLVVLGAHRRGFLRDVFAGTTAERVVGHGGRPVLMVNSPPVGPYRRILAATDLDEGSAHALRAAAALGLLDGADLTVLHAFQAPEKGLMVRADLSGQAVADYLSARTREVEAKMACFLAGVGLDVPSRPRMVAEEGGPAKVIKEAVGRLRPDLVLMGKGQHGVLRRVFLGSVAAEVVPELDCDVLVVPPSASRDGTVAAAGHTSAPA
jgi:nucleotide-binding universal stress UspA family protein